MSCANGSGIARSLKEAGRLAGKTTSLTLRSSQDLTCRNLMCAKLGEACVCRLAVCLSRLRELRKLDIANNSLGVLPDSVFELPHLEYLDVSGNNLKVLPAKVSYLHNLRILNISNNLLTSLPTELRSLRQLQKLQLGANNELQEAEVEALAQRVPTVQII